MACDLIGEFCTQGAEGQGYDNDQPQNNVTPLQRFQNNFPDLFPDQETPQQSTPENGICIPEQGGGICIPTIPLEKPPFIGS